MSVIRRFATSGLLIVASLWHGLTLNASEDAASDSAMPVTVRVLSLNLWHGGDAGGMPIERSVAAIQAAQADIAGLQETKKTNGSNFFVSFAERVRFLECSDHHEQTRREGFTTP